MLWHAASVKKVHVLSIFGLFAAASAFALMSGILSARSPALRVGDNIVMIVIDTLRADRLPFYGYPVQTAPFLDTLAQRAVVFDTALSPASLTAPAVASFFTSTLPSVHGVITGKIATRRLEAATDSEIELNVLPDKLVTLAETLKERGFRTFGVSDNISVSAELGFAQGFDTFKTFRYDGAAKVNQSVLEWEQEIRSGGPYFLYLHYMDPHEPYHAREPWYVPSNDQRQHMKNAYDSEIRYADEHIAELFERFAWMENALVIVTADHGEEFWEHGSRGHGKTLYPEVLHVPLLIYHRNLAPQRVAQLVGTLDLLPTVAQLVQAQSEHYWQGRPLLDPNGTVLQDERAYVGELLRRPEHPRPARRSLHEGQWLYVHSWGPDVEVAEELYNLASDPSALNNALNEDNHSAGEQSESPYRARAKEMRAALNQTVENPPLRISEETSLPLDREALEHLKTLGYVD